MWFVPVSPTPQGAFQELSYSVTLHDVCNNIGNTQMESAINMTRNTTTITIKMMKTTTI